VRHIYILLEQANSKEALDRNYNLSQTYEDDSRSDSRSDKLLAAPDGRQFHSDQERLSAFDSERKHTLASDSAYFRLPEQDRNSGMTDPSAYHNDNRDSKLHSERSKQAALAMRDLAKQELRAYE